MAAPQTMVNSKGYAIGEQVDRVVFPVAEYDGEQSAEYDAGSVSRAIFFLEWPTQPVGAEMVPLATDFAIDAKSPATKQWIPYLLVPGLMSNAGTAMVVIDPSAVQADFEATKAKVVRAQLPNMMRVRLIPQSAGTQYYALSATLTVG